MRSYFIKTLEQESSSWDWQDQEIWEHFIKNNPKWAKAKIIDNLRPNIPDAYNDIDNNTKYVVELNNKYYNFCIKQNFYRNRYLFRYTKPVTPGVYIKRYYRPGEKRRTRNTAYSLDKILTQNIVKINSKSLRNDCQIWTFAILLNISYENARDALIAEGWRENSTNLMQIRWERAIKKLGKKIEQIYAHYLRKYNDQTQITLKSIPNFLPKIGKFAITIDNHILAFVDGKMYDSTYTPPYKRVHCIYEIT